MNEKPNATLIASDIVGRLKPANGDSTLNNETMVAGIIEDVIENSSSVGAGIAYAANAVVFVFGIAVGIAVVGICLALLPLK